MGVKRAHAFFRNHGVFCEKAVASEFGRQSDSKPTFVDVLGACYTHIARLAIEGQYKTIAKLLAKWFP